MDDALPPPRRPRGMDDGGEIDEDDEDDESTKSWVDESLPSPVTPLPLQALPVHRGPKPTGDGWTRIVCMSDTHGQHEQVYLPATGDVLIHAGDLTMRGEPQTLQELGDYFGMASSRFSQIIVIAGNHDVTLQPDFFHRQAYSRKKPYAYEAAVTALKSSCTYLEDEACHLDESRLVVYGSPWSPEYGVWAFTKPPAEMDKVWREIPKETDVLVTHGPPYGRGDQIRLGYRVGCPSLLPHVQTRVRPRLHVFGHIHEDAGKTCYDGQTTFVNACNVNLRYQAIHPCVVVDLPHDCSLPAYVVEPTCPVYSLEAFMAWLAKQDGCDDEASYQPLIERLRGLTSEAVTDTALNWKRPWQISLLHVYVAWNLHREADLQALLRRALGRLYAASFD
jgi:Icc-related predicted phosphoesterase